MNLSKACGVCAAVKPVALPTLGCTGLLLALGIAAAGWAVLIGAAVALWWLL